jgi:hypothetical protein
VKIACTKKIDIAPINTKVIMRTFFFADLFEKIKYVNTLINKSNIGLVLSINNVFAKKTTKTQIQNVIFAFFVGVILEK